MTSQESYNLRMDRKRRRAEKVRKAFGITVARKKVFIGKEFY
jgi:hypothetical protein